MDGTGGKNSLTLAGGTLHHPAKAICLGLGTGVHLPRIRLVCFFWADLVLCRTPQVFLPTRQL